MKNSVALRTIHSEFNLTSANYNGFEFTSEFVHRMYEDIKVTVKGDHVKHEVITDGTLNDRISKCFNKMGKHMSKRMRRFKDPFKGVTGWW